MRAFGLAGLLSLAALSAEADSCRPGLTLSSGDDQQILIEYGAACLPYAQIQVQYGPLSFVEETGLDGFVVLELPRLQGVTQLSFAHDGNLLAVPLPSSDAPGQDYAALSWPDGTRWGELRPRLAESGLDISASRVLGIGAGRAIIDLLTLSDPQIPVDLMVPVTPDSCEQILDGSLKRPGDQTFVGITVTMPSCAATGHMVAIPLSESPHRLRNDP